MYICPENSLLREVFYLYKIELNAAQVKRKRHSLPGPSARFRARSLSVAPAKAGAYAFWPGVAEPSPGPAARKGMGSGLRRNDGGAEPFLAVFL
jgi:hypothetical protein